MLDLIIIGAGAAGIGAARQARRLGLSFRLIEASQRIGGRARTSLGLGVPVDLGCHWLHSPAHNPLFALAKTPAVQLGAAMTDRYWQRSKSGGGQWLDEARSAQCDAAVATAFDSIRQQSSGGSDTTITAAWSTDPNWSAACASVLVAKQGLRPGEASAADFARYRWEGADVPVTSGMGALIAGLGLPIADTLSTGVPVTDIDWSGRDAIIVKTAAGALTARRIIITVSTGVLAHGAIRFAPALPVAVAEAVARLPMAHCNKVALRFDQPVFGGLDHHHILALHDEDEAFEVVVRSGAVELAVCILNGPLGKDLALAGHAAMEAYCIGQLASMFGNHLRSAGFRSLCQDWDGDRWVRGYVSAAKPGFADARATLANGIEDRIFFAGEAVSLDFMGDAHGAWLTGIAAVDLCLLSSRAEQSPGG